MKTTGENSALPQTVQEAVYQTVHQTPGQPPKAIAENAQIPIAELYAVADELQPNRQLKAEQIPALVKATGNTVILDVLEAAVGRIAFRVPPANGSLREQVQMSRDAIKEFSEALDSWCTATDDGHVTRVEAKRFIAQANDAIAAIARMTEFARASA